jgi:hypothetical protein
MAIHNKLTVNDVLTISDKMQGKMTGMASLNTDPSVNPFCQAMYGCGKDNIICTKCYSHRSVSLYKNCHAAWSMNYDILTSMDMSKYAVKIKSKNGVFRFSAHGELGNRRHYENYAVIAEQNPSIQFTLWTKRLDIIRHGGLIRLKNLIHIYSNPTINPMMIVLPDGFNKTFNVWDNKEKCPSKINCQRSCAACLKCYNKKNRAVHIHELLNRGMRDE